MFILLVCTTYFAQFEVELVCHTTKHRLHYVTVVRIHWIMTGSVNSFSWPHIVQKCPTSLRIIFYMQDTRHGSVASSYNNCVAAKIYRHCKAGTEHSNAEIYCAIGRTSAGPCQCKVVIYSKFEVRKVNQRWSILILEYLCEMSRVSCTCKPDESSM